ncbi:hypothetical protein RV11_GL002261 [Enterococcus phoeniculicola]|nr:hypothetical protein RV11_GL002261 [Enterococcus phoeniculicola]
MVNGGVQSFNVHKEDIPIHKIIIYEISEDNIFKIIEKLQG